MKKLFAFILCLSMVWGTTAFATETELNKDVMEGQTKVSLTIDLEENEFVVVIPASVTIDPATGTGTSELVLKSGWQLVASNGLTVSIKEFANGVSNTTNLSKFTLKSAEGTTVPYMVKFGDQNLGGPDTSYPYTKPLISVNQSNSNTSDRTAILTLIVPTLPTDPGEYTDTITFAITLN